MISKITDQIYIGDQVDAENPDVYKTLKFTAVLNLNDRFSYDEEKLVKDNGMYSEWIPNIFLDKGKRATERLEKIVTEGHKVLVHCEAGIDRAPFIVAKYLALEKQIPISKSYNIVKYFRKQTFVHLEWI